jgi:hypothetical protein
MSAKQALLLDPSIVHVYEELSFGDGPKQTLKADRGTMPVDAQRMIQNYIEEGHSRLLSVKFSNRRLSTSYRTLS